jgi:UDP-2,3-diacylglucosamine pyrophosphatase LpxH
MAEQPTTTPPQAPKKIKLVISDLHLGKGRQLENGSLNTFEEFYYAEKLVEFIQYYSSGAYRDYHVEIIINGDFLNFISVDYRGHFLTVVTESIALEMLKSVLKGHTQVFKAMGEFLSHPNRKITYVVGNHDQAMMFQACRDHLDQVVGHPLQYKNIIYFFDGVHIEHGHMHEAANRMDPKKFFLKQGLPEPILNLPWGSHFFVELVLKIKQKYPHVDKVRPFGQLIRWSLVNETWITIGAFYELLKYVYRTLFNPEAKFRWGFKTLAKIFIENAVFPDLSSAAKRILADTRVHTVIFGHTHVYEYRQWGAQKEYFNTGTWTELTSLDVASLGKITKLTYVLLEYADQDARPRGRLKEWKGFHRIEEDVAVA